MQLMRIRKYKTDIHKLGKKYGNLPKNEFIGNNFGYFSASCARYPPMAGPIIRATAHDVLT